MLAAVLLLQLTLPDSGTLCAMKGDRTAGTATHAHMASATMRAMDESGPVGSRLAMVAREHDGNGTSAPGGCDASDLSDSCRGPAVPGSCATMTSCVTSILAPRALASSRVSTTSAVELPEPLSANLDFAIAPELPPPRA